MIGAVKSILGMDDRFLLHGNRNTVVPSIAKRLKAVKQKRKRRERRSNMNREVEDLQIQSRLFLRVVRRYLVRLS